MENEYYCPHCKTPLKIDKHIILTAKPDKGTGGVVLFEPKLGDYNVVKHKECKMKENVHVEFFCPVCHKNLSSDKKNLAEILLVDPEGDEYQVWFSEIIGEQATYKIKAGKVFVAYGEDQAKYVNYFGTGPEY